MSDEKFDKQKHLHAIEAVVTQNIDVGELLEKRGVTVSDMRGVFNLARSSLTASHDPIPMLLWCPECVERHVDRGEFATKPHHTHSCQKCGHTWRPAVVPTVGVQFLPGFRDDTEDDLIHVHTIIGYGKAACGRRTGLMVHRERRDRVTCPECRELLPSETINTVIQDLYANPGGVAPSEDANMFKLPWQPHPGDLPLPPVRTVHMWAFEPPGALCGNELASLHDGTTDPMAATCIECKRVYDKPVVHLVLYGKILCGLGLNPLNKSTAWLEETTCVKCKHIYKEEHE